MVATHFFGLTRVRSVILSPLMQLLICACIFPSVCPTLQLIFLHANSLSKIRSHRTPVKCSFAHVCEALGKAVCLAMCCSEEELGGLEMKAVAFGALYCKS